MSNTKNTGGPAFPTTEHQHTETGHYEVTQYGMTLRDYFAAKAMQEIIKPVYSSALQWFIRQLGFSARVCGTKADDAAASAYSYADAMLKAREQ